MSQTITLFIVLSPSKQVKLEIPSDKTKELTCHWLLEEAIAKLKQEFPEEEKIDDIVALCTVNHEFAVDHWLTFHYKNISILRNGTILKPFYKQSVPSKEERDLFNSKVTLNDFIVEIQLGYGAFSNVYLGNKYYINSL